jgi:hypothetical protein
MSCPLQVYLDVDADDLDRLDAWARDREWTKSRAVRVAIRALTRSPAGDSLLELSGDIDDLPEDVSANIDRQVNETFVAEPVARRTRPAVRR